MTTITIRITDKIDKTIIDKIRDISVESLKASRGIDKLSKALAALRPPSMAGLSKSITSINNAMLRNSGQANKLSAAQKKMEASSAALAIALSKEGTVVSRLTEKYKKLERAALNASSARSRAIRGGGGSSSSGGGGGGNRGGSAGSTAPLDPVEALIYRDLQHKRRIEEFDRNAETFNKNRYDFRDKLTPSEYRYLDSYYGGEDRVGVGRAELEDGFRRRAADIESKSGKGRRLERHSQVNLAYQVQDIGVSLASGQNPLMVMAQQLPQIAGIAMAAGVSLKTIAWEAVKMVAKFGPLVAVAGAAAAALHGFKESVMSKEDMDGFIKGLDLTNDELEKLKSVTDLEVTWGDTFRGIGKTISDELGLSDIWESLTSGGTSAVEKIVKTVGLAFASLVGIVNGFGAVFKNMWDATPMWMTVPFTGAINATIASFETLINKIADGFNFVIENANKIPGVSLSKFGKASLGRFDLPIGSANLDIIGSFTSAYEKGVGETMDGINNKLLATKNNIESATKSRITAEADKIKKDRKEAKGRSGGRSGPLDDISVETVNQKLDNELSRLKLVSDELAKKTKLDEIEESLAKKRIKLTDEERKVIISKIDAIVTGQRVQQAMNSIYDSFTKDLKNYNDGLAASSELLAQNKITQEQYEQSVKKITNAYKSATDLLHDFNMDMELQFELVKLTNSQMDVENTILQRNHELKKEGKALSDSEIATMREKLSLLKEERALQEARNNFAANSFLSQNDKFNTSIKALTSTEGLTAGDKDREVTSMLSSMGIDTSLLESSLNAQLEAYKNFYAQLDALKYADLISERDYAIAKTDIAIKETQLKTQNLTSFLENAKGLQESNIKELAMLGKAAAIAEATINAHTAATKAMAQGGIMGPVMAAIIYASAMAHVASIHSAGYKNGGYTGDIGVNEVAGVVHGREYVMTAAQTDRIGVENLQALASGSASIQQNSESATSPTPTVLFGNNNTAEPSQATPNHVRIINNIDPAMLGDYLASPAGEQVFVNVIRRNADVIKSLG